MEKGSTMGVYVRRTTAAVLLCAVVLCALGCGGTDDEETQDTGVDVTVPEGEEFKFALTGAEEVEVAAQGSDRFQRQGETRLNFNGVANDGENFSLMFLVPAVEGETGDYETVKTSQLTHASTRYRTDRLDVRLEGYSEGRLEGTVRGSFGEKEVDGSYQSISPALEIRGRFDFTY